MFNLNLRLFDGEGAAAGPASSVVTKPDVHRLTKEDRKEIARRVARGEKISF